MQKQTILFVLQSSLIEIMDRELILRQIGIKIRELRNDKNLSLLEFSDRLDIEYNNLIRMEKGRANLTLRTLIKVCEVLEMNLSDLVDVEAGRFTLEDEQAASPPLR
jgi:transcriptional regulator with XRE-family HTH domain